MGLTGVGVPDPGDGELWEVPEVPTGPKVAQIGTQGLPRALRHWCGELIASGKPDGRRNQLVCPTHGGINHDEIYLGSVLRELPGV